MSFAGVSARAFGHGSGVDLRHDFGWSESRSTTLALERSTCSLSLPKVGASQPSSRAPTRLPMPSLPVLQYPALRSWLAPLVVPRGPAGCTSSRASALDHRSSGRRESSRVATVLAQLPLDTLPVRRCTARGLRWQRRKTISGTPPVGTGRRGRMPGRAGTICVLHLY